MALPTKADWENLKGKIVSDLADGVTIASYQMAGRSFGYRSLDEQLRLLRECDTQIARLTTGGASGMFQLARVSDI